MEIVKYCLSIFNFYTVSQKKKQVYPSCPKKCKVCEEI